MDELKKEEPSVVGREKSLSSIGAFELLLQDPKLSSINLITFDSVMDFAFAI